MITSANEYFSLLYKLQDQNSLSAWSLPDEDGNYAVPPLPIPKGEKPLFIDLNTRTIKDVPNFLSVEKDHRAETVFFKVDRYFDNVDLALTTCVIQYVNAEKPAKQRIYAVPFCDIETEEVDGEKRNFIYLPWQIGNEATAAAGIIQFSVKFYIVDNDNKEYIFSLNTQPAQSKILYGLEAKDDEHYNYYPTDFKDQIFNAIANLSKSQEIYWLKVDNDT